MRSEYKTDIVNAFDSIIDSIESDVSGIVKSLNMAISDPDDIDVQAIMGAFSELEELERKLY